MDRFEELSTFTTIVDAGSLTAAADRLEVAKSAVSRRLKELEERLGVQLLQRTTRTMQLTDAGRELYQRAGRLLDDLAAAEAATADVHCDLAGRLRLSVPTTFGHRHLTPALRDFCTEHPGVELDLVYSDRRVDLVDEGFDLAIRIGDLDDSALIARRLATTTQVVCASPEYLDQHGAPTTPEDLLDHRCLVYTLRSEPNVWSYRSRPTTDDPTPERQRVTVQPFLRANSGDFLADAARAGRGIVMEPDFIVYEDLDGGRLVQVLDQDFEWSTLGIWAIYPPTRFVSRRVRAFIDFLAARFAGTAPWQVA